MMKPSKIQTKWNEGYLLGYDCISYGSGIVTLANTYSVQNPESKESNRHWFPLCDTSLEGIEKYDSDIWTEIDIYQGAFVHEGQKFVFGEGAMGNEGFIASTHLDGALNWAIFFTFSNPIHQAKVVDDLLICYGDTGAVIEIDLKNITQIKVSAQNIWAR